MSAELPQNRRECISKIRDAFQSCPPPTRQLLAPDGGIDGPCVHKNWGHLTREDVESLDYFSDYLAEDLTYMSSVAFRYFVPAVMILFLQWPERIDFGGFISMISRCESAFLSPPGKISYGLIALTRPQADAFRDWFGLLMTLIRKFDLDSFEEEYMQRLRILRARLKTFTPDTDSDELTIKSHGLSPHDRRKAQSKHGQHRKS